MKSEVVAKALTLLPSHIPDFIKEESPLFTAFMAAYYEWSALKGSMSVIASMEDNIDIDTAIESFIPFFQATYMTDLPVKTAANPRHWVKFAKEFYQSKGTLDSFKLFFRAIYNQDVDIYTPRDNLFIPSQAEWYTQTYMLVFDQTMFNYVGERIRGRTSGATARIESAVLETLRDRTYSKMTLSNVVGSFSLSETIDIVGRGITTTIMPIASPSVVTDNLQWSVNDLFNVPATYPLICRVNTIKNGYVQTVTIANGGTGYAVNDFVVLKSTGAGSGAEIKITSIGAGGVVTGINLIRSGFNYDRIPTVFVTNGAGTGLTLNITMNTDFRRIKSIQPTSIVPSPSAGSSVDVQASGANLVIRMSPVPTLNMSKHITDFGKPSDAFYIHDSSYYQDFSYEIRTRVDLSEYAAALKRALHPAGTKQHFKVVVYNNDSVGMTDQLR